MRTLTDEQERAVARREGSLLLAAGAGSGKTSVLVERFVRAVREDGVAPGRILAITFTERAAGELRARVRARLLELGERDAARAAEAASVCTFHSFCARLLRAHPLAAGVEPGFEIVEEGFAGRLRALAFADALAGLLDGERADAVDLVAAYGADPLRAIVVGAYAQLRSQGQSEPRLPSPRGVTLEAGWFARAAGTSESGVATTGESEVAVAGEVRGSAAESTQGRGDEDAVRACALIGELLERFGEAYARRKRARAALDFDDLELDARELLRRRADVRVAWAERFELLMVDEFQDTNPRQLQLLAALDRDNLFTVGDQLQSIYGFRHADVRLFRERHARLDERGASLALTRNFRSRPAILAAVERIFAERMGERFTPLVAARADEGGEPSVELLLTDRRGWERLPAAAAADGLDGLPDATPWRQAEARLLAGRVAELVASGRARAGEVVVLLRALGDLPVYESALRAHGLRTLAGVGGFWGHQQVGDLLAWLRALANPLDELALYSTLASPLVGVSSDGLALIARAARDGRGGVWRTIERAFGEDAGPSLGRGRREGEEESGDGSVGGEPVGEAIDLREVLPNADRERVAAFRELFAAERATAPLHPLSELPRRAIAATGYEAYVRSLDWGQRRLANIHKLVRLARRFEAREGRDLRGFLDHVAHVEVEREADAPVGDGEIDAVRLMSIHAAKGLEFPVVCVADLGREPNLRLGDLLVDGAPEGAPPIAGGGRAGGRVGLRLVGLGDPEPVAALDYERLREQRRAAQEEEEDRVLYVACTRAERRLLLSGAVAFERWPAPKPGGAPIAWLAPALVADAPRLAALGRSPAGGLTVDAGDGLLVRCAFNAAGATEAASERLGESVEAAGSRARSGPGAGGGGASAGGGVPASATHGGASARRAVAGARGSVPTARLEPIQSPLADPDATMSYTSLHELELCGYRYYLERVLRLPENHAAARAGGAGGSDEHGGGIEARTRGTIVHALLESVDFTRPAPPTANEVARVARRIGVRVSSAEREEIATLIGAALAAEPARRLATARRARSEHPFAFSLAPGLPLVTGVLDLIVEQPSGASLIVDYKSDRLAGGEDLERVVLRDYGFQRLLYALAAIEHGAREVEVAHWFLERPAAWVSAIFISGEQGQLREQLLERLERARVRGWAVTREPHRELCLTCPGRGGLCSWGETHTMNTRSAALESDR